MPAAPRSPTLQQLAARVDELSRKVAALERPHAPRRAAKSAPKHAPPTASSDDLLQLLARDRAAQPRDRRGRGVIAYGGSLEIGSAEYLWAIERPLPALLAVDPAHPAHVLAMLAHPQRLRILLALLVQPRTAAELQKVIHSSSPGPLYHHLRDLVALGVVAQRERRYTVPARHVVPLLAAVALTLDLAANASTD